MLTLIRGPRASGKTLLAASIAYRFRDMSGGPLVLDEFDGNSAIVLDYRKYIEDHRYVPLGRTQFTSESILQLFEMYPMIIIAWKTDSKATIEYPADQHTFVYDLDVQPSYRNVAGERYNP
jgi:hypothetical protein